MKQPNTGNLLLVSNYSSDVGYAWWLMEHFWTLLAEHFERNGAKTYLAYPKITSIPDAIRNSNIEPVELTVPGATSVERGTLRQFMKKRHITNVYFTDRPWFNPGHALLRAWGAKTIVVHDHTPGDRPPVRGIKGALKALRNRLPLICADAQFCVSDLMRTRSIENGRLPAGRCLVVQNGIPPVSLPSTPRATLRERLDIPDSSTVCITTGRAHPYKRFDFIVDVAAEVNRRSPANNLVFLLLGNGPALESLRNKTQELNLDHMVRLPGFRGDARDLLSAADMAMHAALGEGFSLSIVEYMSAGLPVLVPDIPSVKQAIDHQKNGMIYGKNNVNEAATHLLKLYEHPEFRMHLGNNARSKANRKYTLDTRRKEFIAACRQVFS